MLYLMYEQCPGVFLFGAFFPSQQNTLLNTHPALVKARLFQEIPGGFFNNFRTNRHFRFFLIIRVIHHSRAQAMLSARPGKYIVVYATCATFPECVIGG